MKEIGLTLKKMALSVSCLVLPLLSGFAQEEVVQVELLGNAPAENLIAAFDGPEADGVGWFREAGEWKDLGFSFRSPADSEFQKVTLRIQAVRGDFQQEARFRLDVYENVASGENPADGKLVYSGSGQLAVRQSDIEMYLSFTLGKPVPLISGNSYTVVLSWEEDAPVIVFQANPAYTEGFIWYRTEGTEGRLIHVTESVRPGVTHFIQ